MALNHSGVQTKRPHNHHRRACVIRMDHLRVDRRRLSGREAAAQCARVSEMSEEGRGKGCEATAAHISISIVRGACSVPHTTEVCQSADSSAQLTERRRPSHAAHTYSDTGARSSTTHLCSSDNGHAAHDHGGRGGLKRSCGLHVDDRRGGNETAGGVVREPCVRQLRSAHHKGDLRLVRGRRRAHLLHCNCVLFSRVQVFFRAASDAVRDAKVDADRHAD